MYESKFSPHIYIYYYILTTYIYIYTHDCVYIYIYIHMNMYVCMCIYIHIHELLYIYINTYIYIHISASIYIYTHVDTCWPSSCILYKIGFNHHSLRCAIPKQRHDYRPLLLREAAEWLEYRPGPFGPLHLGNPQGHRVVIEAMGKQLMSTPD